MNNNSKISIFIKNKPLVNRAFRILFYLGLVGILSIVSYWFSYQSYHNSDFLKFNISGLEIFNTIFTSILMQAFPFMLIGILVSSAMHIFIPSEWIVKIFPTKHGLGFLTAMFAGIFFPVCECAIVPVMTRLVRKGVPMPIAITFMLSAPIINPIVIISTLYAFPGQPEITIMRVCFGLLIALLVGLAMSIYGNSLPIFIDDKDPEPHCHCTHTETHSQTMTCHIQQEKSSLKLTLLGKIKAMLIHMGDEFFGVGKYLIIGAFFTSLIQVLIPKEYFVQLGAQQSLSLLIMMTIAFIFSACSTSDAFIARNYINNFSTGSILGFLIFGPMMDIKNLLMLLANFRKGFVIRLSLLILAINFIVLSFLVALVLS